MPTREMYERYRRVQLSGNYNMLTEATYAAAEAGLCIDDYWAVIRHYNELYDKYGEI